MVRLTCGSKTCNHVWNETKKQSQSENVYCPKCGALHHTHTKPINPTKPFKVRKKKEVDIPIPQPLKPYQPKVLLQKGMLGKTVKIIEEESKYPKTRKVEKE